MIKWSGLGDSTELFRMGLSLPTLVASTLWPRVPPSNAVEAAAGRPRGPLLGAPKSRRHRLHARQRRGW
jgi:hypothetical protein